MADSYCGKTCADCAQKEQLNCPGCKSGPGRPYSGDCALAKCLREKGHETCDTCSYQGNCRTLANRDRMPDYRLKKIEEERIQKAAMAKRAPILGKWLWVLFWLIVPGTIGSFMSDKSIAGLLPGLLVPGRIITLISNLTYGAILLKLASEEASYRTAGICALIAGSASFAVTFIPDAVNDPTVTLLIKIPIAIVALVREYNEYMGHSAVLDGVDNELSEKWSMLWKWYVGVLLGMIGGIFITLIIPILGALAIIASAIGILVVDVLKLVYLYRSAKVFREYPV